MSRPDPLTRLIEQLQRLPGETPNSTADMPQQLLEAARTIRGRTSHRGELIVDPGRHIAGLLADGPVRLGKFDLLEELGAGSFGYVFRARDTELDRVVAVKIQRAGSIAGGDEVERFQLEYWDYWREIQDLAGQPVTQFFFVEMDTRNGWFQMWRGTEIDPKKVMVL